MTSVRRALALSFVERYVLIAIALLSNILIARLLTPEQIGLYSVSLAVIGIAQALRDFGIGNFLIQEKNLNETHIRTAFGFSLLLGGGLFVIVYLAAPFAGNYYGDSRMVQTIRISTLNFLVLPFCTISLALLRRNMAFNQLIIVNLIAAAIGSSTTIGLAYWGFGPNSMAVGSVVGNIVTGSGAWLARTDRKMLLPGFSEWQALLNFGGQSTAINIVTTISMNISDLAFGKILGFVPVAMISRAQGLMNLFHQEIMGAIRNVAFPAFSKIYREGGDLESRHIFAVGSITVLAWPFYAFMSLFSLDFLRLFFGPQWDSAASLVPWFCLAGAVAAPCSLIIPLLMAQGRIDIAAKIDLVIQPLRAIILVVGAVITQSTQAVAILFAIIFTLGGIFNYHMKSKYQATEYKQLFRIVMKSALVTIACLIGPVIVCLAFPTNSSVIGAVPLLTAAFLCTITWFASLIVLRHPLVQDPFFHKLFASFLIQKKWRNQLPPLPQKRSQASQNVVIFAPDWSQGNPYQALLKAALEKQHVEVELRDFPKGFFSLTRLSKENPTATVLHIHWINNLIEHIIWSRNRVLQSIKLLLLALDIFYLRYRGIKVVWTVHNLVSHECPNYNLEIKARKIIARACSRIITHSESALLLIQRVYSINLKEKASVIPHGNYDGCYAFRKEGVLELKNAWKLEDENIVMLFFGGIRPYKGIENLITTFLSVPNHKLRLVIAGNSPFSKILDFITAAATRDPRIIPLLRFIPDEDVAALFSIADVVVVPFEKALTSGTVVLALSMGKALFLPKEARVFDLVDESGGIFFDSASSMKELIISLDKDQLTRMGKRNRSIADQLDWSYISARTAMTYR
ncbi:MAG: oligosaccharide flippase family protein [Candidatus Competibacter sp.]|nr:oligosaccharide flippase family protein [Candidatus Competibacter sp.]